MISLKETVNIVLKKCMGLRQGEKFLVVCDKNKLEIAKAFLNKSKKITPKAKLLEIPIPKVNSEEPPEYVAKEMLKYDVIVITTTKSLTHTLARKNACEKGARIASMPNITKDIMQRAIAVDYDKLKKRTEKLRDFVREHKVIRVVTEKGTDITMGIVKKRCYRDAGLYDKKSSYGNLPAGEFGTAPLEGSSNGVFVVDASMAGTEDIKVKTPIKITVKDGFAVKIEGGKEAKELNELLKSLNDKNVYTIAEIGIGTNDKAKISGTVLEDEKVLGTAHIALGDNFSLGGEVQAPAHLDGVFYKPTIYVDDKKIMEKGRLLI